MSSLNYKKLPRLYIKNALFIDGVISLNSDQAHYLRNVLRKNEGDQLRIFNGCDGEWLASLTNLSKKSADITCLECLRKQPTGSLKIHLLFAPIKKNRMDFLVEKAVELGVTHLHPILSEHTEVRKINCERLEAQIREASEQSERLSIPALAPLQNLTDKLANWSETENLLAAIERMDKAQPLKDIKLSSAAAFLIGPEGGFSEHEISFIQKQPHITPISLGSYILRSETAALKVLSVISEELGV